MGARDALMSLSTAACTKFFRTLGGMMVSLEMCRSDCMHYQGPSKLQHAYELEMRRQLIHKMPPQ
jgi:hypothetical protein